MEAAYLEIQKLRELLLDKKIPFAIWAERDGGYRIDYPVAGEKRVASVIQNWCSYGGKDNKPAVRGPLRFDSQKEARRYDQLVILLRAGVITDLKLQPEFTLVEGFRDLDGKWHRAMKYRADFSYQKDGELVVEDVKSEATRQDKTYRAKAKMLRAVKGIEIKEV